MDVEIRPEPSDEIRRVILVALADGPEADAESAWWRAGLAAAVDDGDD